jgi:hypothetical protein
MRNAVMAGSEDPSSAARQNGKFAGAKSKSEIKQNLRGCSLFLLACAGGRGGFGKIQYSTLVY